MFATALAAFFLTPAWGFLALMVPAVMILAATALSFNPSTHTFRGNPEAGDASPLQIRVTATDGQGGSGFDDFQLSLVNVTDSTVTTLAPDTTHKL